MPRPEPVCCRNLSATVVVVRGARNRTRRKVGICGQAPSDYPDFAAFLVERGIDSVSLSPDAVVPTTLRILEEEGSVGGEYAESDPGVATDGTEDQR